MNAESAFVGPFPVGAGITLLLAGILGKRVKGVGECKGR